MDIDNQTATKRLADILTSFQHELMKNLLPVLDEKSLTLPQFFLLGLLRDAQKPLSMTEIANLMQHSTAATTGIVDRMERQKLLKRSLTTEDRRMVFVTVSSKGIELLSFIQSKRANYVENLMSGLKAEERSAWVAIYEKILAFRKQEAPAFENLRAGV